MLFNDDDLEFESIARDAEYEVTVHVRYTYEVAGIWEDNPDAVVAEAVAGAARDLINVLANNTNGV